MKSAIKLTVSVAWLMLGNLSMANAGSATDTVLVRHGITLNGYSTITGTVRQLNGENVICNGRGGIYDDM